MNLNRRTTLKALGSALAIGAVGTNTVTAGGRDSNESVPSEEAALDYLANDSLLDNTELESILQGLTDEYSDLISVSEIGRSNQDRPIYAAAVGTGDTDVMAIGQQHGDEMVSSSEGLVATIQYLARGNHNASMLTDELTVHIVPRVNPDGFVARQRYNVDTDAPARGENADIFANGAGFFTADEDGIGWDINRYNWTDWTESNLYQEYPDEYPENPVPESQAVVDTVEEVDPDWIIDYHRQGEYVVAPDASFDPDNPDAREEAEYPPDPDDDGSGTIVTGSVFWPIAEGVPQDAQDLSKQMVATMVDEVSGYDRTVYTRYPGGTYPGIARNAYGLDGRGSVLFELSAGTLGDREFRIQQVMESLLGVVEATADGSLDDVDPNDVDDLPEREFRSFTIEGE
jgi:hypothetical protein